MNGYFIEPKEIDAQMAASIIELLQTTTIPARLAGEYLQIIASLNKLVEDKESIN